MGAIIRLYLLQKFARDANSGIFPDIENSARDLRARGSQHQN